MTDSPAGLSVPQPPPVHNNNPSCHDLVIADMLERKEFGLKKYGTILQPENGRDFLIDAYQEVLDLSVYLRGAIHERQSGAAAERVRVLQIVENLRRIVGVNYKDPDPKYNTVEASRDLFISLLDTTIGAIRE